VEFKCYPPGNDFSAAALATLCVSVTAAQMSDAEADQLDCSHFKRNADGTGEPKARIGKIMAGAQTFVRCGS
jgi:hypothetical protein